MPTIRDRFTRQQLRWSDIGWGPVDLGWPAISFATGTTAWSQLQKLSEDDVVISACAGQHADAQYRGRITGISIPHHFTAPTRDIVHPETLKEVEEKYGVDRWPDSIACRTVFKIAAPPRIDEVLVDPRLVTGTRGRYLADLSGVVDLYEKLADLEIEELKIYKSPQYLALSQQPRQVSRRQAGWTSTVPKEIQGILDQKVKSIFAAAAASGGVYAYQRPDRIVLLDQTPMFLMLLDLWNSQDGRCSYCRIPLETSGLAQVSVDRIDNNNREYGKHNVHLTCWECNRGKGTATHEEMVDLWEKRKRVWAVHTTIPTAAQSIHDLLSDLKSDDIDFDPLQLGNERSSPAGVD